MLAFENGRNALRLRDVLEAEGIGCVICRSAAEVRRVVRTTRVHLVACGFKLADDACEALRADLPEECAMLMIAPQSRLDLCADEGICKLAAPVGRGELLDAVNALLIPRRRPERPERERELLERAKELLMTRDGLTEAQAHRWLQKRSMARGVRMIETAQSLLEGRGN